MRSLTPRRRTHMAQFPQVRLANARPRRCRLTDAPSTPTLPPYQGQDPALRPAVGCHVTPTRLTTICLLEASCSPSMATSHPIDVRESEFSEGTPDTRANLDKILSAFTPARF